MKKARVTGIRVLRLGALAALLLVVSAYVGGQEGGPPSLDKDVAVG